jgi:RHS repeat-associated protein
VTGSYLFNAFNQRVQKVVGGTTTQFVYDEAGHLLEEANASGVVQREYIWLGNMPAAVVDDTGSSPVLYFIHADQIGTPQKITDGSLNIVWDGVFDPFGNVATASSLSLTNLRFPGQYFDSETSLNQNWNRDYDPTTGRYIQRDPLGLFGGTNTYAYVDNNPISFTDPMGLAAWWVGGQSLLPGTVRPHPDIPGGPWTPAGRGQLPGSFYGPSNLLGESCCVLKSLQKRLTGLLVRSDTGRQSGPVSPGNGISKAFLVPRPR